MEPCSQRSCSLPSETKKAHRYSNGTYESLSLENYQHGGDHRIEAKSSLLETHEEHESYNNNNKNNPNCSTSNTHRSTYHEDTPEEAALRALPGDERMEELPSACAEALQEGDGGGRERLKRHRIEVSGRVWIPDLWGQEDLLKDWIDCSAFDASLVPNGIMSARAALVEEGRRPNSSGLRIENRC